MRSVPLVLSAAVVMISTGWSAPQVRTGMPRPVNIIFRCETTGGASVIVNPWRVQLGSRVNYIEWSLVTPGPMGSGPDSVVITPKAVAQWPFTTSFPIVVKPLKHGIAQGVPTTVPAGTYKYNITGICHVPGMPVDTVTIDPDMIIPT